MAADNAPLHLACIGLGALGTPMALNLVRAGHRLTVFNRDSRRCRPLAEAGAQVASSAAEAAAAAEQLRTIGQQVVEFATMRSTVRTSSDIVDGQTP